jgi:hypothetical protein
MKMGHQIFDLVPCLSAQDSSNCLIAHAISAREYRYWDGVVLTSNFCDDFFRQLGRAPMRVCCFRVAHSQFALQ